MFRSVQQHQVAGGIPGEPPRTFDGVAESDSMTCRGLPACSSLIANLKTVRPVEEKFLDLPGCEFFLITENVVFDG